MLGWRIDHDGQGKVAQRLTVAELPKAVAKVFDVGLLGIVAEHIALIHVLGIMPEL
jgi:hypothetical protein